MLNRLLKTVTIKLLTLVKSCLRAQVPPQYGEEEIAWRVSKNKQQHQTDTTIPKIREIRLTSELARLLKTDTRKIIKSIYFFKYKHIFYCTDAYIVIVFLLSSCLVSSTKKYNKVLYAYSSIE